MKTTKRSPAKESCSSDLFEVVMFGKLSDVKQLVQSGTQINKRKKDGFTALMLAISRGDKKITEYLIKQGADVNLRNEIGQTALMIAALGGQEDIVEWLAKAGADVNAVDNDKRNAIAWAASRGDFPGIISMLAVFGTNYNAPDVHGLTPLMRAALLGYANSVATLLTVGADDTIKFQGKTAYDMAVGKGHTEICKIMKTVLADRPRGRLL